MVDSFLSWFQFILILLVLSQSAWFWENEVDSAHKRGNPEIQGIWVYGLSDNACGRKLFEKNMGRIVPSFNFGHGICRLSTFLWVTSMYLWCAYIFMWVCTFLKASMCGSDRSMYLSYLYLIVIFGFIYLFVFMYLYMCAIACVWSSEDNLRDLASSPTMWVLAIKFRPSGFPENSFTSRAISLSQSCLNFWDSTMKTRGYLFDLAE